MALISTITSELIYFLFFDSFKRNLDQILPRYSYSAFAASYSIALFQKFSNQQVLFQSLPQSLNSNSVFGQNFALHTFCFKHIPFDYYCLIIFNTLLFNKNLSSSYPLLLCSMSIIYSWLYLRYVKNYNKKKGESANELKVSSTLISSKNKSVGDLSDDFRFELMFPDFLKYGLIKSIEKAHRIFSNISVKNKHQDKADTQQLKQLHSSCDYSKNPSLIEQRRKIASEAIDRKLAQMESQNDINSVNNASAKDIPDKE